MVYHGTRMTLTRPRRNPEVVWREEARGAALSREQGLDAPCATLVHLGTMYQLNLVGAELWKRCDGTRTPEQLAVELLDLFEVEPAVLGADVRTFLGEMEARGWLVDGTEG